MEHASTALSRSNSALCRDAWERTALFCSTASFVLTLSSPNSLRRKSKEP